MITTDSASPTLTRSEAQAEPETVPLLPPATCSAAARERLETAEAALMRAAMEFAYQWGRDQTGHPKMYWLELHLENWRKLARAALAYSECVEPPTGPQGELFEVGDSQ